MMYAGCIADGHLKEKRRRSMQNKKAQQVFLSPVQGGTRVIWGWGGMDQGSLASGQFNVYLQVVLA